MKKLSLTILSVFIVTGLMAQVEVGKAKSNIMGKSKLMAMPVSELLMDHFHVNFTLYSYAQDAGGSSNVALSSKVGVKSNLVEVDKALAQEITNEAYAYFVDQWKQRGVTLTLASKEDLESNKVYQKAVKKKKPASIINGGVNEVSEKKVHTMQAWPEGVNIASTGNGPLAKYGNGAHFFVPGEGKWTGFNATMDFISYKTAKIGSSASVKSRPKLTLTGGLFTQIWEKFKIGGYLGGISAEGTEDFYSDVKKDEISALGTKMVTNNYVADRAKFKTGAIELLKASMDASFADYDETVAKNRK